MAKLYVMVPGQDQAQLVELDELLSRLESGELPDTVRVARLGETTWIAAKELAELRSRRGMSERALPQTSTSLLPLPEPPSAGGTASSGAGTPSSVAGTPRSGTGTPSSPTSHAGSSRPASPSAGPGGGLPRAAVAGAGAGFGLLIVFATAFFVYRGSYQRGLVLEHVPGDCAELYYVDLAGIVASDPVRSSLDKLLANSKELAEEEVSAKSKKDKARLRRALEALEKNGVTTTTVREAALCVPMVDRDDKSAYANPSDKAVAVLGGTFRKGDVLQGLKEAVESALKDEDACKLEDDDGLRLLKCTAAFGGGKKDPVYAALVDSRVLAIGADKRTVKSVRQAKDRSKLYGADKGEHVVVHRSKDQPSWDGSFGESRLKVGGTDTVLTVETHYDPEKGKSKLAQFKDGEELVKRKEKGFKTAADGCFEKTPYDMLSESVERTKVEAFDDGLRYEWKVSNKDLGTLFKVLADADKDDITKLFGVWMCVGRSLDPWVPSH